MPRVLFLTDSLSNGGAERQLELLVKNLPPEWERRVWSLNDGPYNKIIKESGVEVFLTKRRWRLDVSPAFNLWKLVNVWQPDIIHAWGWMSALAAVPICRLKLIPLINGSIRSGRRPIKRAREQGLTLKLADSIIANSQAGLLAWGIDSKRGRVVYNGFDPLRIPLTNKQVIRDDRFCVIMTGRMVREKDYSTFFEAAGILSKKEHGWRFIAVGYGAERLHNLSYAEKVMQNGIVEFPEPGLEVLEWVRKADVGVLLTNPFFHAEGCSNSIMEYMACGLPVICSEGGGNHEIVLDSQTGFLIPPLNPEELANKLFLLRHNLLMQKKMGKMSKDRFTKLFKIERMVNQTVNVYHEVNQNL
jgi:glycosyltransferase involved in cell wall biosynthesis